MSLILDSNDKFQIIQNYVNYHGGYSALRRILIANNGIAAVKGMRSIRQWAYEVFGDERIFEFIVMTSPEDVEANAEYIKMADFHVVVPGGKNKQNYANVDLIIEISKKHKIHAVWVGWGHASENPKLPELLSNIEPPVVFIGPSSTAMNLLGDKVASTLVAQSIGIPTVSWSGSNIKIDKNQLAEIPNQIFESACAHSVEEALKQAKTIGFPLVIKASEGGGGKGIRVVSRQEDVSVAFRAVQIEVPNSPIFLMKLLENVRHLEVQLIADNYQNAITVYGRDCSIQRRHQKIIEEAPITIAPDYIHIQMEKDAKALALSVGYTNVGTVEFLYSHVEKKYWFLELNPRLQVEHPTTEMISGLNIPSIQLLIAMGTPLYRIPSIRKMFNHSSFDDTKIDFNSSKRRDPKGHVIAARITAENPDAEFRPCGGRLKDLSFKGNPNAWGYFSVGSVGGVHEFADSQFGHIFARGTTREEARKNLSLVLRDFSIRAEFYTITEFLISIIEKTQFKANSYSTSWLDNLIKTKNRSEKPSFHVVLLCSTIVISLDILEQRKKNALNSLKSKVYPSDAYLDLLVNTTFEYDGLQIELSAQLQGKSQFYIFSKTCGVIVPFVRLPDGELLITFNGHNNHVFFNKSIDSLIMTIDGKTCVISFNTDPSIIRVKTSARLLRYLVKDKEYVKANESIAELEIMKMYSTINTEHAGQIKLIKQEGSFLNAGEIIAYLKLDESTSIKIQKFDGVFPEAYTTTNLTTFEEKTYLNWKKSFEIIKELFNGYQRKELDNALIFISDSIFQKRLVIDFYLEVFRSKRSGEFIVEFSLFSNLIKKYRDGLFSFKELISSTIKQAEISNNVLVANNFSRFDKEPYDLFFWDVNDLLEHFINQEEIFNEVLDSNELVEKLGNLGDNTYTILISRRIAKIKAVTLLKILNLYFTEAKYENGKYCLDLLKRISVLKNHEYTKLSAMAKEVILYSKLPSWHELEIKMAKKLKAISQSEDRQKHILNMSSKFYSHLDVLPRFFHHENLDKRLIAMEIYVRRIYEGYRVSKLDASKNHSTPYFCWVVKKNANSSDLETSIVGSMIAFSSLDDCFSYFEGKELLDLFSNYSTNNFCSFVMYIVLKDTFVEDDYQSNNLVKKLQTTNPLLFLSRIAFIFVNKDYSSPRYFTFNKISTSFQEDRLIRNIEPEMSHYLELDRINYFYQFNSCFADHTGQLHIYLATSKKNQNISRIFIRIIIRPIQTMLGNDPLFYFQHEANRLLSNCFDAVEAIIPSISSRIISNHIFFNILPPFNVDVSLFATMFCSFMDSYRDKFIKLKILQGEIRLGIFSKNNDTSIDHYRFFLSNDTLFSHQISTFKENQIDDKIYLKNNSSKEEGLILLEPYPDLTEVQIKRYSVQDDNLSYVYDYPSILETALIKYRSMFGTLNSSKMLEVYELDFNDSKSGLVEILREPGCNKFGMVAWKIKLYTPEAPSGRYIIMLANDISFQNGTFSTTEDLFYKLSCQLAREHGIPFVYISVNSGARFGLCEKIRKIFQVKWIDDEDPSKGFEYLYFLEKDYLVYKDYVVATKVNHHKHGSIYRINSIIGDDDIGVENLHGSALIAREASAAYDNIFTVSYVSGRSVGIGAYLVRLNQRVIQRIDQPIILTGYIALNKILGVDVYSSNLQIGGPSIMFSNGITHLVANDDLDGFFNIIKWISYVPIHIGANLPICITEEDSDAYRKVETCDLNTEDDPRTLLTGFFDSKSNEWKAGLLDRGSWFETLTGWARTVICGRGRIGGLPIGIIIPESRTIEYSPPIDPASSSEYCSKKIAGSVWYPDSAFKTAQSIRDFNREQLPLLILANWRGFSGGMTDLYNGMLKYGSDIVDALRKYQFPVFVYLFPHSELRGGSWVVIDSSINEDGLIEMYADSSSRGGILEPSGIVSIKYKNQHFKELSERLNVHYEENLLRRIATQFADLHDRVDRLVAHGLVRKIIEWSTARTFFFNRFRRRYLEERLYLLYCKGKSREKFFNCIDSFISVSSLSLNDDELVFKSLYENEVEFISLLKAKFN